MKLSFIERLVCCNPGHPILPEEGYSPMLRIRLQLIEKIGLTAKEWKKYKVTPGPEGVGLDWRRDLPQDFEIGLTPAEIVLLAESLANLERTGKLRAEQLSLYEKFVENGNRPPKKG